VLQLVTALGFAHVDFTTLRDNDVDGRRWPLVQICGSTVFGMRWVVLDWVSVTKAAQAVVECRTVTPLMNGGQCGSLVPPLTR